MKLPSFDGGRPKQQMVSFAQVRLMVFAASGIWASLGWAQAPGGSTLPPATPTSLPTTAQVAPIAATPVQEKARRADVTFRDGLLDVKADNSSLNSILHAISRQTGMKITGGVADQRVFGDYGPALPSTVLSTLLDGTGVNMQLQEGPNREPIELVLTARDPAKPPPTSLDPSTFLDAPEPAPATAQTTVTQTTVTTTNPAVPAAQPVLPQGPQPVNNPMGSPANSSPTASTLNTTNSVPIDTLPTPTTVQNPSGIVDAPNPPPAGSTSNANGTLTPGLTPEMVMQQMQQLQQQKQANSSTTTTTTTTTTTPATSPK